MGRGGEGERRVAEGGRESEGGKVGGGGGGGGGGEGGSGTVPRKVFNCLRTQERGTKILTIPS